MKHSRIQEGYLPLKVGLKSVIKVTCLSMIGQFFSGFKLLLPSFVKFHPKPANITLISIFMDFQEYNK